MGITSTIADILAGRGLRSASRSNRLTVWQFDEVLNKHVQLLALRGAGRVLISPNLSSAQEKPVTVATKAARFTAAFDPMIFGHERKNSWRRVLIHSTTLLTLIESARER
jgi:hypothetical protein